MFTTMCSLEHVQVGGVGGRWRCVEDCGDSHVQRQVRLRFLCPLLCCAGTGHETRLLRVPHPCTLFPVSGVLPQIPLKTSVNTVQAKGSVERWLLEVEERMVEAVHDCVSRGITAYPSRKRHRWVMEWPGMVVLVGSGVYWTQMVEAALAQGGKAVVEEERRCSEELMRIVDGVRGELTGLQRATLGALVVMDVHSRDVVSELVRQGVTDAQDFGWQAQLRTYWQPVEELGASREWTVVMRMMSSRLEYGYEYLGNSSRLVVTPLTDRCYRTLISAIHLNLGGAPEGPAGTGKTETTKDLAKALARQVGGRALRGAIGCAAFGCRWGIRWLLIHFCAKTSCGPAIHAGFCSSCRSPCAAQGFRPRLTSLGGCPCCTV